MRVSLSIVKQFVSFDLPIEQLVDRINRQLGGVEKIVDLNSIYKDARIVRVVEVTAHPDADRLSICKIDDGGVVTDVPRDDNGYVQVVCGAPNVHSDMFAVWLPPSSTVPVTYHDTEPFVLSARELRGVLSQGMLAAGDELGINNNHDGIIEIDPAEWKPGNTEIVPGASFAEAYGLNDFSLDIENKMFTHRPDCFGQLGVAREIAGILGQKFASPKWYIDQPRFDEGEGLDLEVYNDTLENVPRFMAVAIKDITIKASPLWLQCALVAMGSKSINNVVDITNYIMLLTAQPTHAYDYDKIRGHKIGARMARSEESIILLNGKTYELTTDDIVIADADGPVGLAGIMGGANSEVDEHTKNILLEVATFDMYTVRKTAMRHGVFTDALARFNKGQSPFQNDRVLRLLMQSTIDVSHGKQASRVFDMGNYNDECLFVSTEDPLFDDHEHFLSPHGITQEFINRRLGLALNQGEIATLLTNVEFIVKQGEDGLEVYEPFWRTDIVDPEDIVEEVGRLYGYDRLPKELPSRSIQATSILPEYATKAMLRNALASCGANEVLTYSFVHENTLKKAEQSAEKAFKLANALSPELQYYRLSVLPSLLDKVHMNSKVGYDEFTLYEIGKAHHKDMLDDDGLPREFGRVAGVYSSRKTHEGAAYFRVKNLVEQVVGRIGGVTPLRFQKLTEFDFGDFDVLRQLAAPFDPERSSMLYIGEQFYGVIGEFKSAVTQQFKLPEYTAGFELFLSLFTHVAKNSGTYRPLSRFPSVVQDISLRVSDEISYDQVYELVDQTAVECADDVVITPLTIYKAKNDATKTFTFRLQITSHERTLTDASVRPLIESIARAAETAIGAVVV